LESSSLQQKNLTLDEKIKNLLEELKLTKSAAGDSGH